jgi:hypothetical protein
MGKNSDMEKLKKFKKKTISKKVMIISGAVIVVLLVAGFIFYGYTTINSLNMQQSNLKNLVASTNIKNKNLSSDNKSLQQTLKTLQDQINRSNKANELENTKPKTKVEVLSTTYKTVHLYAEDFSSLGTGYENMKFLVVSLSVTNQSAVNQSYGTNSFYTTSTEGKIVRPFMFKNPSLYGAWSQSELAPNGHENITLMFPSDQELVNIITAIPNTTDQILILLPRVT